MILRAECISERVLNGNMSPQKSLCYLGATLEEGRGNKGKRQEKAEKKNFTFRGCLEKALSLIHI